MNFEQKEEQRRDVGGPPSWVLMLFADVVVAWLAGLAILHTMS